MKIGIAAPVSLKMLSSFVPEGEELPEGHSFPLISVFIQEYLNRGHSVSVFALDPTTTAPRTVEGQNLTIHIGRFRPRARHRALDFFALERRDLLEAMRRDPCDIIHAHWTYEFALAALASGRTTLVTAHDTPIHVLRMFRDPYRFIRTLMAYAVSMKTENLTAVSPFVAHHFHRFMGYTRPITVIPNGLQEHLFALGENRNLEHGAPPTFASVLTGWGRMKNGCAALQAFAHVRKVLPDARLWMFGYGHGPGEGAERWAQIHNLCDGVTFWGQRDYEEMLRLLAGEAHVLVHPSLLEACPMAIAESMAMGIPVIAGHSSGGVPWMLQDGAYGMLVDVRDPDCIAEAMIRLGRDAALRQKWGMEGRQSARERFHLSKIIRAYEMIYSEISALPRRQLTGPHTLYPYRSKQTA